MLDDGTEKSGRGPATFPAPSRGMVALYTSALVSERTIR